MNESDFKITVKVELDIKSMPKKMRKEIIKLLKKLSEKPYRSKKIMIDVEEIKHENKN